MTLTIGPTSRFAGDLTSQEDVLVHGTVKGQIVTESGTVRVAPQGHVEADVRAAIVTIDGTFDGRITASTRVDLTATAKVTGSLTTPAIVLRDGASFHGTIEIARKVAKVAPPAAVSSSTRSAHVPVSTKPSAPPTPSRAVPGAQPAASGAMVARTVGPVNGTTSTVGPGAASTGPATTVAVAPTGARVIASQPSPSSVA